MSNNDASNNGEMGGETAKSISENIVEEALCSGSEEKHDHQPKKDILQETYVMSYYRLYFTCRYLFHQLRSDLK